MQRYEKNHKYIVDFMFSMFTMFRFLKNHDIYVESLILLGKES